MEFDDDIQDAGDTEDEGIGPKWFVRDVSPVPHSQEDNEDQRNEAEEQSVDPLNPGHGVNRRTRRDTNLILCFVFSDRIGSAWDRRTSHLLTTSTTNIDVGG